MAQVEVSEVAADHQGVAVVPQGPAFEAFVLLCNVSGFLVRL